MPISSRLRPRVHKDVHPKPITPAAFLRKFDAIMSPLPAFVACSYSPLRTSVRD